MAKQKSLIKITGKSDGQSFYYSKLGGYQMRKIDPNISERVKTDPRYVNTRYAAAEFKGCARTASLLVRAIAERWRFFTNSQMVADLTKYSISQLGYDTLTPFGQRSLRLGAYEGIQQLWNEKQKLHIPGIFTSWLKDYVTWNASTEKVNIAQQLTLPEEYCQELLIKGATHINVGLHVFRVYVSHYDSTVQAWLPGGYYVSPGPIISASLTIPTSGSLGVIPASTPMTNEAPQNIANIIGGVLLTVMPDKSVNHYHTVLQRLCSCYWYNLPDME